MFEVVAFQVKRSPHTVQWSAPRSAYRPAIVARSPGMFCTTIGRDAVLRANIPEIEKIEFQMSFECVGPFGEHRTAVVDALINGCLVVELDGRLKYDGTYGAPTDVMLAELERQKQLQNLGLTVIRAGWRDVMGGKLIDDIRRLLRADRKAA